MDKKQSLSSDESIQPPRFVRNFSPEMIRLLEQHFWCDFSDINPALSWEEEKPSN